MDTTASPLQLSLKSPSSSRVFHRRSACAAVGSVYQQQIAVSWAVFCFFLIRQQHHAAATAASSSSRKQHTDRHHASSASRKGRPETQPNNPALPYYLKSTYLKDMHTYMCN
jgi:hypothetical protein